MKSKIRVFFSIVLFVLMIAIVVSGYWILSSNRNKKNQNETKSEYSIIVDDNISVYVGDTYTLVPYLVRKDGTVEESRFQYTPSTNDITVSDDGVVSVKNVPNTDKDVKINIFERNTSISTDVNVNIIGKLTKVLGITFSDSDGNKMLVSGKQNLQIGDTYLIDIVTEPRNAKIKDNCKIKALDSAGNEKEIFEFSYTNTNVAMTVVGLGSGKLQLDITNDEGQSLYTTDFDFSISMKDEELGNEILHSSNSTLLSKEELNQIEIVELSQNVSDLESLKYLPSLKTVVFLSEEVMEVENISQNYFYRVKTDLFNEYLISEIWSEYLKYLIPYEETAEELYVVYHNDKTSSGTEEITYDRLESLSNFPSFIYEGYQNFGWLDENGENVSLSQIQSSVKRDGIHLYAGWEPITYKIIYHIRDFDIINNEDIWHYDQENLLKTPNDFSESISRIGYKFAGRTRQSTSSVTSPNIQFKKDVPVSNLTSEEGAIIDLYDIWEPIEYTLIFTKLDGMEELDDLTVKYNTAYTLPTPSRPGYEFINWKQSNGETLNAGINDPNKDSKLNLSITDGEEIILTPEFKEITYTIIFKLNGGQAQHDVNIVEGYRKTLRYTESYTLPYLTREGYTTYSWVCDSNNKTYGSEDRIVGEFTTACEVTFTAIWTSAVYTINYDCNGGYINDESYITSTRYWDDGKSLLIPTKKGYTFAGWQDIERNTTYVQGSHEWTDNLIESSAENGAQFNLKAIWEVNYYNLTISTGEGTTLIVKVNNVQKSDGTYQVAFNSTITVSYSANTGYSNATCTFTGGTMPAEDKKIITSATVNRHKIIIDNHTNATITVTDKDGNAFSSLDNIAYGTAINVSIKYSKNEKKSYSRVEGNNKIRSGYITEDKFSMPDCDVTLSAYSECFATGTLIRLADGTTKPIEDIKVGDMVMTWNFFTGNFEAQPVVFYWDHGIELNKVINLNFSNGKTVKIIANHGFFDITTNKFEYIDANNFTNYIGHYFAYWENGNYIKTQLSNVFISKEITGAYSLETAYNGNVIVEGLLTLTPQDIPGLFEFFDVGDELKYDETQMLLDIEKYGLYTYEEWSEYVSYEVFELINGKYFKILVGKGIITEEDIIWLIENNLG